MDSRQTPAGQNFKRFFRRPAAGLSSMAWQISGHLHARPGRNSQGLDRNQVHEGRAEDVGWVDFRGGAHDPRTGCWSSAVEDRRCQISVFLRSRSPWSVSRSRAGIPKCDERATVLEHQGQGLDVMDSRYPVSCAIAPVRVHTGFKDNKQAGPGRAGPQHIS